MRKRDACLRLASWGLYDGGIESIAIEMLVQTPFQDAPQNTCLTTVSGSMASNVAFNTYANTATLLVRSAGTTVFFSSLESKQHVPKTCTV